MSKPKNRWLIAASAMGVHVSIGSVYAYSVFKKPLLTSVGWDPAETAWAFSIAILVLGLSAAFLGPVVERVGPRVSGQVAAVFYGLGLGLAGYAVSVGSLPLFYLGYGGVAGIGLGIGYICPVATLVRWFPDRRGLATGLAVMGFGFGALFASRVFVFLIEGYGIPVTFYGAGAVYFVVMSIASWQLSEPPAGWMADKIPAAKQQKTEGLTSFEALRTPRFYLLWAMLFLNITCGIAVISTASPLSQEIAGLSAGAAATMVGLMGLFNGLGRIGWSSLSDYAGRANTFALFCVLQLGLFFALPHLHHPWFFQAAVCLIISCYGGGFALMPAFIGDVFGTKNLSAILGCLLTAWAAAGLVGPMLNAFVYQQTSSYTTSLYLFGSLFIVALGIVFLVKREGRRAEHRFTQEEIEAERKHRHGV